MRAFLRLRPTAPPAFRTIANLLSLRTERRIPPYVALIPICVGVFVAADDQTVIVTVLPEIMLDLKVPITELDRASWTITGYLLGYVVAMPLIGRVSDIWGHSRLFIGAMVLFMVMSVVVALSPNLSYLIGMRVVQALGAGALVPISIAIAGDLFPAGRRGLPLGLIGASAEAGGVIGPLWGGLMVRYLDWTWVFWMNVPLGALILLLVVILLPPSPRYKGTADYLGGALIALSLAALTLGLSRIDRLDAPMAGYLVLAVLAMVLFLVRQRTTSEPLFSASMFRELAFRAANSAHLLVGGALIIGMITIPLMADTVLGQAPLEGGLRLMRLTAAIPVGAVLGGMACQRWDYRLPTVLGLLLAGLGFAFMSRWDLEIADPAMTIHLATAGLGFGLLIAPIALAATESVHEGDRGAAAALVTAMRVVGMTVGLAALTAWGSGRFDTKVSGMSLPLLSGGTTEEVEQLVVEYTDELIGVGLSLFNEFFLIAMAVCLVGIVPAALMAWNHTRRPGDAHTAPVQTRESA